MDAESTVILTKKQKHKKPKVQNSAFAKPAGKQIDPAGDQMTMLKVSTICFQLHPHVLK
jgi:hypothetical protein